MYTVKSLAEYWQCSPDVVYDLLRSGKLKGFHVGGAWRISDEARRAYEEQPPEAQTPRKRKRRASVLQIS